MSKPRIERRIVRYPDRLSGEIKRLLAILLAEEVMECRLRRWTSARGRNVQARAVSAAFDRYLISVVYRRHYRDFWVAKLTDIGRMVALSLAASEPIRLDERDGHFSAGYVPAPVDAEAIAEMMDV